MQEKSKDFIVAAQLYNSCQCRSKEKQGLLFWLPSCIICANAGPRKSKGFILAAQLCNSCQCRAKEEGLKQFRAKEEALQAEADKVFSTWSAQKQAAAKVRNQSLSALHVGLRF